MLNHDQTPAYTRSAIQAMARAVDAEPDFAGWLADVLARTAAHAGSADALTAGRPGSGKPAWSSSSCSGTVGYGDDEHLPSDGLDGHARPDLADMKTALGLARVILDSADLKTAHEAAEAGHPARPALPWPRSRSGSRSPARWAGTRGSCPSRSRRAMLAAVQAAEGELRGSPN